LKSTRSFVASEPVIASPETQAEDSFDDLRTNGHEKWQDPAMQFIGNTRLESITSPQNLILIKNFSMEQSIFGAISILDEREYVPPVSRLRNTSTSTRLLIDLNIPNLQYHKKVSIRYTFNDWKDKVKPLDVEAKWIYSLTPSIDVFRAELSLLPLFANRKINSPDQIGLVLSERKGTISFCVRCFYGTDERWHNNNGQNYQLEVRSLRRRPVLDTLSDRLKDKLPSSPLQLPAAIVTNVGSTLAQPIPKLAKPRSCYDLNAHLLRWNAEDHSMVPASPSPPLMIL